MHYNNETSDGQLVTGFTLGEALFGVDAHLVQEVVKVGDITRVHNAPASVVGIRNLRGRIVTVVDMAVHLNLGSVVIGTESRLLIMEHQGEPYGFLVDSVADAIALDEGHIDAPPASLAQHIRSRLRGVWRENEKLTAILDPQTLFEWQENVQ
jgi:purine-binding chemotaxis protein CheW